MAVQIMLVDAHREGDALEQALRGHGSVTRARSLEGARELLRWFDHRVIVVCLDGGRFAAPPDAWAVNAMPPVVTCGAEDTTRARWSRVARGHVSSRDDVVAAVSELLAAAPSGPTIERRAPPARVGTFASGGVCDMLDGARDGCLLVDGDQTIVLVNDAARELLEDWGPVEVGQRLPAELRVAEQEVVTTGSKRSLALRVGPGASGASRSIWVRDVTDQVRTGDLERRLLHSDRLAAMGQLAAGVAHEVNNPAAFVTANLCMMAEYVQQLERALHDLERRGEADPHLEAQVRSVKEAHEVPDALRELSDIIQENLDGMSRISTIVRDLRNFSRIEESHVELIHPNEVVNSACSIAHNQIRHRARLIKELAAVPQIPGDRNKLVQVLMNLLMNAAQALPDGDGSEHFVRVATEVRNEQIHISVTDNGCGIPHAIRSRIFDPFFTTKGRDRGTGLGLALCADIVRQHGGDIEVRSEEGEGSCFIVRLPVASALRAPPKKADARDVSPVERKEAPAEAAGADTQLPMPSTGGDAAEGPRRRVLLVDDEIMLLRAFSRALSRRYEVEMISSGEEALERLAEGERWDVIVCDLMMPGVDGIRVYESLDKVAPDMKDRIIFCSGGAFTSRAREFCEAVVAPILDKPLRVADLEVAIDATLDRARPAARPRLEVCRPPDFVGGPSSNAPST